MRYFIKEDELKFYKEPNSFSKYSDKNILKYAIGANLYMPAIQQSIFNKLLDNEFHNIGAITLCMEDSIDDTQIEEAQFCVLALLERLYIIQQKEPKHNLPLIFVRVRNEEQFHAFSKLLKKEHIKVLCGINFPKFNSINGGHYFSILKELSLQYNEPLYGMPIIEDELVMYKDTRFSEFGKIQDILKRYDDYVLNLRVGGTDFSSIFGLRRDITTSIYDIKVVADCLKDILNYFIRKDCRYVVSGPAWEYYSWDENSQEIQGLKKELNLDIQNGFHGKTVIHPSQIDVVNKAYVIKFEEWQDANNILNAKGGVFAGYKGNRMNEVNPHRSWAKKILAKAEIYGVANLNAKF